MDIYKTINQKQYDILRDIPERIKNEYASQILKLTKKGDRILDVGFGSGSILFPLVQQNKHALISGIDYSKSLHKNIPPEINKKAEIIFGDILKLNKYYNIIHFKAILHCFKNAEIAIDKIKALVKKEGYLITGHENSQIEDRIEQIFNSPIEDTELELLFEYYFTLRLNMHKPFIRRPYPAGDAINAVNYICKDKRFKLIKTISNKKMSWNRKYALVDVLYSIKHSTYNVFNFGLDTTEKKYLYKNLLDFSKKHKMDLKKERTISSSFTLFIIKRT